MLVLGKLVGKRELEVHSRQALVLVLHSMVLVRVQVLGSKRVLEQVQVLGSRRVLVRVQALGSKRVLEQEREPGSIRVLEQALGSKLVLVQALGSRLVLACSIVRALGEELGSKRVPEHNVALKLCSI